MTIWALLTSFTFCKLLTLWILDILDILEILDIMVEGVVYIYKSVRSSNYRANYYGMAYKKQVCKKSWVNSVKKRPSTGQITY